MNIHNNNMIDHIVAQSPTSYFCINCGLGDHNNENCPHAGLCKFCKERKATLHFGDLLSFTHGGNLNCCEICCTRKQLDHARMMAATVDELAEKLERLENESRATEKTSG